LEDNLQVTISDKDRGLPVFTAANKQNVI